MQPCLKVPKDRPVTYLGGWSQDVGSDVANLVSIVTAERVVFNIRGNAYRLIVAGDFEKGIVRIKWIGTHKDNDRIDLTKVEHGK